jgi:hypothetical protein
MADSEGGEDRRARSLGAMGPGIGARLRRCISAAVLLVFRPRRPAAGGRRRRADPRVLSGSGGRWLPPHVLPHRGGWCGAVVVRGKPSNLAPTDRAGSGSPVRRGLRRRGGLRHAAPVRRRLRPDGRWEGRYRPPGGKRRSVFATTRTEVQERLRAALTATDAGIRPVDGRMTVSGWLAQWLDTSVRPRLRPATVRSYEQVVRLYLAPSLGRVPLARLTPSTWGRCSRPYSRASRQRPPDTLMPS